jgi:nucleolar GTP-binding protein
MMKFQNIPTIEPADQHLDIAFRKAKARAETVKQRKKPISIGEIKNLEEIRLTTAASTLTERFQNILKYFPYIPALPLFYRELIKATVDVDKYEDALQSVEWTSQKTTEVFRDHCRRLRHAQDTPTIHDIRRSFYGRISSIVKRIDTKLNFLNKQVRPIMRTYPLIKELPTVAIAGFPNVGKTTLLSKISSSKPEIAEYAFTTQHLNLGYIMHGHTKIQLVDTPGTLARPNKMNNIEKQAYVAIRHLANLIIFIFDPTEPYPLEKQEELLELVKKENKTILLYMSKADIATEAQISKAQKLHKEIIFVPEQLQKQIFSWAESLSSQ